MKPTNRSGARDARTGRRRRRTAECDTCGTLARVSPQLPDRSLRASAAPPPSSTPFGRPTALVAADGNASVRVRILDATARSVRACLGGSKPFQVSQPGVR
jgi:hypothetical protein